MPAVSRKGDTLTTGHGCDATTTLATPGQTSVFANNIRVARITDPTVTHLVPPIIPPCSSHASTVKVGSDSVFVEGLACARIGDSADAGAMITGSDNVFAGG